jgi:hypothetical protein
MTPRTLLQGKVILNHGQPVLAGICTGQVPTSARCLALPVRMPLFVLRASPCMVALCNLITKSTVHRANAATAAHADNDAAHCRLQTQQQLQLNTVACFNADDQYTGQFVVPLSPAHCASHKNVMHSREDRCIKQHTQGSSKISQMSCWNALHGMRTLQRRVRSACNHSSCSKYGPPGRRQHLTCYHYNNTFCNLST